MERAVYKIFEDWQALLSTGGGQLELRLPKRKCLEADIHFAQLLFGQGMHARIHQDKRGSTPQVCLSATPLD